MEQIQQFAAKELPIENIIVKSNSELNLKFDFSCQENVEYLYQIHLYENAKFTGYFNINKGSCDISIELHLHESGASAKLFGTYQLHKQESIILNTRQHHHAPHTISDVYIKGVMHDASQANYKNMINIEKQAQQSKAHQQIKYLLISPLARIIIWPNMQVETNNISCKHGASASKLDSDQLYYMQSRGLSIEGAKQILINAFLNEGEIKL